MKYLALSAMAYCVWITSAEGMLLVLFGVIIFSLARGKGMLGFIGAVVAIVASVLVFFTIDISQAERPKNLPSASAMASVSLGWRFMSSSSPNYYLALKNNQIGVGLNHPEGAANIGLLYEKGWGVKQDYAIAATWYKKAIAMGLHRSPQADYQLAGLYENGLGVERDFSVAKEHYSVALEISANSEFEYFRDSNKARLSVVGIKRVADMDYLMKSNVSI